jgi:hypothetical protein
MKIMSFCLVVSLALAIIPSNRPIAKAAEITTPSNSACQFSEVYQQRGWRAPGLAGAKPKGPPLAVEGRPGAFITDLNPGNSREDFALLACSEDIPGRLSLRFQPVKVLSLSRIEFDGKVYGYYAEYEAQMVTNGYRQQSLEFVRIIFSDGDGSGKFKVLRYGGPTQLIRSLQRPN